MICKTSKYLARITLLAFIFNAMLPFFAVYNVPAHASDTSQLSAVFGEKLLICTGDGFKWVSWKELQNQKPHDAPDHAKCPLCYLAAHGLSVITPEPFAFVAPAYGRSTASVYSYQASALALAFAFGSRAPPVPSFG